MSAATTWVGAAARPESRAGTTARTQLLASAAWRRAGRVFVAKGFDQSSLLFIDDAADAATMSFSGRLYGSVIEDSVAYLSISLTQQPPVEV